MASFYHSPVVAKVAWGIAPTILVTSTSVIHLALLKRAMKFSLLSLNDIAAGVVSVALAIVLASRGWGYRALVIGTVARPLVQSVGAWYLCKWVPRVPRWSSETVVMVRFALNVYGRFVINYFARNMDNVLVGWRFSAQSLGFYKKAYDLFALSSGQLVAPLTNVAVSALSRLDKGSEQYRRYFFNCLDVLAFVGMAIGMILTLTGKAMIRLLLGPGWEPAGHIFMFFGPGIGVMLLYGTHGWIHLSIGRADRWFRWVVFEFMVTGILFVIGLPWGPLGIAAAWTVSFWILLIPAFWYAGQPIALPVTPVLVVVWKYVLASLAAGLATIFVRSALPSPGITSSASDAFLHIITNVTVFAIFYLGAVVALHRSLAPVRRLVRLLREMVPIDRFLRVAPAIPSVSQSEQVMTKLLNF